MVVILFLGFSIVSADTFGDALTDGKISLLLRYRYEHVDQEGIEKQANASTLKTALGYRTGDFHGFSGYLQFENTTVIGNELFNSTTNGKIDYPVVPDPEHSEVNQVYISFNKLKGTEFRFGRQVIILNNARFVGNVGWRQNETTHDALTVTSKCVKGWKLFYGYTMNVNRLFSENHPENSDFRMNSHLINLNYTGLEFLNISVYGYLLDFDDLPDNSNKTFGIRLEGNIPVSDKFKLVYTGEYANQSDYADGLDVIDAEYMLGELGAAYKFVIVKMLLPVLNINPLNFLSSIKFNPLQDTLLI